MLQYFFPDLRLFRDHFGELYLRDALEYGAVLWICSRYGLGHCKIRLIITTDQLYLPTRFEVQKSRKSGKNIPEMHDLAAFERVKLSVMDGLVGGRVRFEYPK